MEKIVDVIESIANEKSLDIELVRECVKNAFINTAKKLFGEEYQYEAVYEANGKNIKLYQKILVVEDEDERALDSEHFITLSKAKQIDKVIDLGDELTYKINLENLGRTASQTLAKEFEYHIQKLQQDKIFADLQNRVGTLINGTVIRVDSEETTFVELDDCRAYMPRKSRIKGEHFKMGDHIRAVIKKVLISKSRGVTVELSRTSPKFLEAMLKAEVPEITDGAVQIIASARIPGERAKVAILSNSSSIDPVGATVGTKGVRITAVSKELKDENIDVIEYTKQPEIFISRAMSPAIVNFVKIEDKKATVFISPEQKSKAIGKSGINIRLASMLTGFEITIEEAEEEKRNENKPNALESLKALFGE